jgi:hypothetical protein
MFPPLSPFDRMSYSILRMSGTANSSKLKHIVNMNARLHQNPDALSHPLRMDMNMIRKNWNLQSATHHFPPNDLDGAREVSRGRT